MRRPLVPLLLGLLLAATSASGAADIPGSAVMAPKSLHSPEPPVLAGAKHAGANVGLWVRADGTVESAEYIKGTPEWKDAVLAAVKEWRFEPVLADGKPIPVRVKVGFTLNPAKEVWVDYTPLPNLPGELHQTKEWGLTDPVPANELAVVLPVGVRGTRAPIAVALKYVIETDGTTGRFELKGATSEYAVRAALDLVSAFRFEPAKVRDAAVPVEVEQKVSFMWTNELVAALDGAVDVADPVFPYDRLLNGQEGRAKVRFRLSDSGRPEKTEILEATCAAHPDFNGAIASAIRGWMAAESVTLTPGSEHTQEFRWKEEAFGTAKVKFKLAADGTVESSHLVSASHPDYGAALVAAVESWEFTREAAAAQPEREYAHEFRLDETSYGLRRFTEKARKGEMVSNAKGIDARPATVARARLAYPCGLFNSGVEGAAKIEFIVDRSGLAVMPRVVEATNPEFGWAAATWVNSWRFKPVTRAGQPVDVRIVVPVTFSQPKKEAPAGG